ncbi:acyl-CoA dehydrogenase family protein [Dactylosporangium sucinum]|uniref:Acyl-CoA dehydrogenase n=1 Tax=Dactylosporangium sucinum TaxID=1424081 RepID=A0A917U7J7_9ACTN|nr:acyl-CoA dehydrogenase family protein [Dactylosporangium sucinum]GGM64299.1 acyl-CoA dehydrogenase [Dactylosporangium sucinum]
MQLPTSDQDDLRDACRSVLADHCTSAQLRVVTEAPAKFDGGLWKVGAELGWNALTVPEEHGGLGLGVAEACIVAEEFGRVAQASPLGATLGAALIVAEFGPPSLCGRLLPLVAAGTAVVTWGSGQGAPPSPALRQSGEGYVLDGACAWVPDAPSATHLLVAATFEGRAVAVLVDVAAPGVQIAPMQSLDIGRRHGRVSCADVVIAPDAVLRHGAGDALFNLAVTLQCAETVGLASTMLAMTVEYTKQRNQFGEPIGRFQALKHRMTDMLVQCEAARATTWEAAAVLDDDLTRGAEAASVAKSITGRAGSSVASEALQLHGGIGFTWEHDLHIFLRRAKVSELLLGSPSWHDERLALLLGAAGADD